jgi:hypothetical protein
LICVAGIPLTPASSKPLVKMVPMSDQQPTRICSVLSVSFPVVSLVKNPVPRMLISFLGRSCARAIEANSNVAKSVITNILKRNISVSF